MSKSVAVDVASRAPTYPDNLGNVCDFSEGGDPDECLLQKVTCHCFYLFSEIKACKDTKVMDCSP